MEIAPGTIRYEIERIRAYVVSCLANELRGREIPLEQIQRAAHDSLTLTEKISSNEEIKIALETLVQKYPFLQSAQVDELSYEEGLFREEAATQVTELLRQGKLDEAMQKAHELTTVNNGQS